MQLIDIGANLTHDSFDHDRDAVMARARAAGVARMVVTEAFLVWAMSVILGSLAGPVILRAFIAVEALLLSSRDPYRPVWGVFGWYAFVVLGIAAAMAIWPALVVSRRSVVESLRVDS